MVSSVDTPKYELAERGDTLAQQIYKQLAQAILSGMFAPNERLNIRRLAEDMGVSATPAREALLRLISDEVLQISAKGAILVPERGEEEVAEIFSIRRLLEGKLAHAAAANLTKEDDAFLTETQENFMTALRAGDYKAMLQFNSKFHFRIYERADQPITLRIVESLWLRIGPTLHHMYPYLADNRSKDGHHENIITSAKSRDAEALSRAITGDLSAAETALKLYLADTRKVKPAPKPTKFGVK